MQESAQVALFWLRANAERYGIDPRDTDVHLHVSGEIGGQPVSRELQRQQVPGRD